MDENTWRVVQIGMWLLGLQTGIIVSVMGAFYTSLSKKIDKLEARIDKLEARFEKLETKVNDIDTRLHVIESILHMKEFCALQNASQLKKAE